MANNEVCGPYDQWSMVVIYDPKTGDMVHTHRAATTRGGTHPDPATLEKLALTGKKHPSGWDGFSQCRSASN